MLEQVTIGNQVRLSGTFKIGIVTARSSYNRSCYKVDFGDYQKYVWLSDMCEVPDRRALVKRYEQARERIQIKSIVKGLSNDINNGFDSESYLESVENSITAIDNWLKLRSA